MVQFTEAYLTVYRVHHHAYLLKLTVEMKLSCGLKGFKYHVREYMRRDIATGKWLEEYEFVLDKAPIDWPKGIESAGQYFIRMERDARRELLVEFQAELRDAVERMITEGIKDSLDDMGKKFRLISPEEEMR